MAVNRELILSRNNYTNSNPYDGITLASITISDSSQSVTSANNLLGYRPRFADSHSSNLAAVFINLEGVFPCIQQFTNFIANCHIQTSEEDGFRSGRAFIDAADAGNSFRIFSSTTNIWTYGIAIQNCPEFTTSCLPTHTAFSVACYLPRSGCS